MKILRSGGRTGPYVFEMSVQYDARIRYNGSVSVYFGLFFSRSLGASLAIKPFDGGNLTEELTGRRSPYIHTIETETNRQIITR